MDIVIIGASAAGLSCLDTLNKVAPGAVVTVVSGEPYPPYCRCLLSYYIGRSLTEAELTIKAPADLPRGVRFVGGRKAERIDTAGKTVRLEDGETLAYDKLLIATGAGAVKPPYCDEGKNCFVLRTMDDARKIAAAVKDRAVVAGGGFIGIKTAYGFIARNAAAEMVVASPYPLAMVLDEASGRHLEKDLAGLGLKITTGDDIAAVDFRNGRQQISLKSGRTIDSDVVVAGKGVRPDLALATTAGVKIGEGIAVDEHMETSVPDIFAAGDCCETYDPARSEPQIIGLWPAAAEQGYYAALNMAGYPSRYGGTVAMNSLKTSAFHLISAGVLKGDAGLTVYEKSVPARKQFRKIACRGDVPVGLAFYNCPEDAGLFVNLIRKAEPLTVDPQKAVNGEIAISDLMKPL